MLFEKEKDPVTDEVLSNEKFCFRDGSSLTPAHHCNDFRFRTYAPDVFRYFRELFKIKPEDFLVSIRDFHKIN